MNILVRELIFMRASCWRIVSCTLLVGLLGGTFVYAKSTEVQRLVPKRNRDNITVLTIGSHGVGPFYSGRGGHWHADFMLDPADNDLFDIFCSTFDGEWIRPGQNSFKPALQRLRGPGSNPPMPTRRRFQLRPC